MISNLNLIMKPRSLLRLFVLLLMLFLLAHGEAGDNYPDEVFTDEEIKYGGFLLYLAGIMYCFLGIALVTQSYINPSIDIIKQKGVVSIFSEFGIAFL